MTAFTSYRSAQQHWGTDDLRHCVWAYDFGGSDACPAKGSGEFFLNTFVQFGSLRGIRCGMRYTETNVNNTHLGRCFCHGDADSWVSSLHRVITCQGRQLVHGSIKHAETLGSETNDDIHKQACEVDPVS